MASGVAWSSPNIGAGSWCTSGSAEFLQTGVVNKLRWMRMIGDTIFAFGAVILGWFVLGLVTGHSFEEGGRVAPSEWEIRPRLGDDRALVPH